MKLIQNFKINLWQPIEGQRWLTIRELAHEVGFQYLPQLCFQNPKLKMRLLNEGLAQAKRGNIPKMALETGKRWKKEVEEGYIADVSVRWIDAEVGYGLFSERDFDRGEYVGEYTGHVRENNDHMTMNNYLYSYPLFDDIGRNYVIDATCGNLMRFANHSFHPNLKPIFAFVDGFYHMILFTLSPISRGAQVTYNYGKNYWIVRSQPKELDELK